MSDAADGPHKAHHSDAQLEILVTATQAYPRLEDLFLSARRNVVMGFRLFDPRTRLQSDAAQDVGATWADLFLHTLNRGVSIDLTVSDFDPVMAPKMHQQAWQFVAIASGLNEISQPSAAKLTIRCLRHPARGGIVTRLMFAPKTRKELRRVVKILNDAPSPETRLRYAPGLRGIVEVKDGEIFVRRGALPQLHPVTLHHKMAVFDDAITYVGGLDLNERRVDDAAHDQPAQSTWHDLQLVTHDPAIATDAAKYLRTLPAVIARKAPVPPITSAFRTTLSRKRRCNTFHLGPETVSDAILTEQIAQIMRAKHLIYLESQYFRDRRIVKALVDVAARNADLRVLILLPAAPEDVAFDDNPGLDGRFGEYLQARALRRVRQALGARFLAVSPVQQRRPDSRDIPSKHATLAGAPIVYVHSKVSIFDNRAAIVSSANLNGRSMKWDAEAGVLLTAPAQVTSLMTKIFDHWLGADHDYQPDTAFDIWAQRVRENSGLPPKQRIGFIVPHDIDASRKLGVPLPGAPEEMV